MVGNNAFTEPEVDNIFWVGWNWESLDWHRLWQEL